MDCVSPIVQNAANVQSGPAANSIVPLADESDAASSFDDPPLETCKRELEAVLASLDA